MPQAPNPTFSVSKAGFRVRLVCALSVAMQRSLCNCWGLGFSAGAGLYSESYRDCMGNL